MIYLLKVIALAIIYHLAARVGLMMAYVQANTSPLWPPTGIGLVALFILGYNVSTDPVGELLDAVEEAKRTYQRNDGSLTVIASVCGTSGDPQDLGLQVKMLQDAGVLVYESNAKATAACSWLLGGG